MEVLGDWRHERSLGEPLPELSDALAAALLEAVDCPMLAEDVAIPSVDLLHVVEQQAADVKREPASPEPAEDASDRTSPASSPAVGEKEQKRRLANQRKYSKKMARRRELQEQAAALEKQVQALAAANSAQAPSAAVNEFIHAVLSGAQAPRGRTELEKCLRTALRAKMLLREENAALRRQFMASTQLHLRLNDLLFAEHTLCMAHSSYFAIIKPLTPERCLEKHAEVESVVTSVTGLTSSSASTSMGSVCGWREDRAVDGSKFRFLLRKTFRRCRARDMCDQTFAFLLDPSVLSRFYSESLSVRLRIMQRVDDDNVVFFEELVLVNTPAMRVVSKSIMLMSRIPIANGGFRICMRCLDADELPMKVRGETPANEVTLPKPVAPIGGGAVEEMWKSRIWWVQIDEDGEEDCVVSYAGIVPISGSTAWFLMGEVLVNAIRWELKMKGSPFGLRV